MLLIQAFAGITICGFFMDHQSYQVKTHNMNKQA